MISKYSKYVPLNLPEDNTTELFVRGMEKKAQQIEENTLELQSYSDKIASIDIARASDKEYFDAKYNELLTNVNTLSTVDFSSPVNIRRAKESLGAILNDKRIINSRLETENYRTLSSEWDKVKSDPRLAKYYHSDNYNNDMRKAMNWLNSDDPMAKIGVQGASLYTGIHEELDTIGQKTKAATNEYQVGEFTNALVTEKNKLGIQAIVSNNAQLDSQLRIQYEERKAENPQFDQSLYESHKAALAQYKEAYNNMLIQDDLHPEKSTIKPEFQNIANYYKAKISELSNIDKISPDQRGFLLYKNDYEQNFVAKHGSERSVVFKKNDAAFAAATLGIQKDSLVLKERQINNAQFNADRDYNLEVQQLAQNERKLIGEGKIASGDTSGVQEDGLIDIPVTTKEETPLESTSRLSGELHTQSFNALKELINDVKQLPNSRQAIDAIESKLKQKGINVDLDAKDLKRLLLIPKNLEILSNAMDTVISNSGKDLQTPNVVRIREGLSKVSNLNTIALQQAFKLKKAKELALKSLNLKEEPKETFNPFSDASLNKKNFDKEVNRFLGVNESVHYQNKAISLSELDKKKDGENLGLASYLNSLKYEKGYFEDEKGAVYRTSKNAVIKDKKASGSTGDLVDDIDLEKSDMIYLDPKTNRIKINARDKENKILGTYYLKINPRETKVIAEKMKYDYNKLIDATVTEDTMYDEGLDLDSQKFHANQYKYLSSSDLGIPGNAHISFRTIAGSKGRRIFALNYNNETFELHNFASLAHMKQVIANTYKARVAKYLELNPSATQEEVRKNALEHTMLDLRGEGNKVKK